MKTHVILPSNDHWIIFLQLILKFLHVAMENITDSMAVIYCCSFGCKSSQKKFVESRDYWYLMGCLRGKFKKVISEKKSSLVDPVMIQDSSDKTKYLSIWNTPKSILLNIELTKLTQTFKRIKQYGLFFLNYNEGMESLCWEQSTWTHEDTSY